MPLIVDGHELNTFQTTPEIRSNSHHWDSCLPGGSAPSSIHSDSSHNSDELSMLESINGCTRDRILSSGDSNDKAGRKLQSLELWKLPDDEVGDGDSAGIQLNIEVLQLNETLRSLMETKTPMLPSRLRTALKPQPLGIFVEPRTVASHPGGISASAHDDIAFVLSDRLNSSRECDTTPLPQRCRAKQSISSDADYKTSMVTEFVNGSDCIHTSVNLAGKKYGQYDVQSVPTEPSRVAQSSAPMSSVPSAAAEADLFKHSAPLSVPDTNSLDSLIARYRNLRECPAVDKKSPKAGHISGSKVESEAVLYGERLAPSSVAVLNMTSSSAVTNTAKTVNQSVNGATHAVPLPTAVPSDVQESANIVSQVDRAADADVDDDLCNDSFDDIRLGLQNVSVDSTHTPLHASSQAKGLCCK